MAASFSGGAKLQAKLKQIAKQIEGKHTLRVGFLEGGKYPDENGHTDDVTAAQTAFWLNYGHGSTPPRPFFTDLIATNSDSWGDALGRMLEQTNYDVDLCLNRLGEKISDQIRDAIFNLDSPALSPITIMLRHMRKDPKMRRARAKANDGDPELYITGATIGQAARLVDAGEDVGGTSTKIGVDSGHMSASVGYEVNSDES